VWCALCEAADGLYIEATEATEAEALRGIGVRLHRSAGAHSLLPLGSGDRCLAELAGHRATPVVIDASVLKSQGFLGLPS
jgi:hypothetical protein